MTDEPRGVARTRAKHALSLGQMAAGQAQSQPIAWTPNWIDYRSSVANVDRREAVGGTPTTCDHCSCETDIHPAPHSPRCPDAQQTAAAVRDRVCLEDGCEEPVRSRHGKRCPAHADQREKSGRRRYQGKRP